MKKLILLTSLAIIGHTVFGQTAQDTTKKRYYISKGSKVFSAGINGGFSNDGNQFTSVGVNIFENSGFFVKNNFAIGPRIGYGFGYSRYMVSNPSIYERAYQHTPSLGVFLRYYKMFTPRFGFFGEFNATGGYSNLKVVSNNSAANYKGEAVGIFVGLSPQLVYFITNKLAVEAGFGSINYNITKSIDNSPWQQSGNFGLNPNLNFSLAFYFGKGVQLQQK